MKSDSYVSSFWGDELLDCSFIQCGIDSFDLSMWDKVLLQIESCYDLQGTLYIIRKSTILEHQCQFRLTLGIGLHNHLQLTCFEMKQDKGPASTNIPTCNNIKTVEQKKEY